MALIFVMLFSGFAAHLFHEFGHWITGTLLGNEMSMRLNLEWPVSGSYIKESHSLYVTIGGPAFTILLGSVAFLFMDLSIWKKLNWLWRALIIRMQIRDIII